MRRALVIGLLTVFGVVGAAPSASADQLRADRPPETSPELSPVDQACHRAPLRHQGQRLGSAASCIFVFRFDDLMEIDLTRDHGVVWVQATVDPAPGWCPTRAGATVSLSDDFDVHAAAPVDEARVRRAKRFRVDLPVTAGGHALSNGYVRQRLTLLPGLMSPIETQEAAGAMWRGRTRATVALSTGIAVSWPTLDPPSELSAGLNRISLIRC